MKCPYVVNEVQTLVTANPKVVECVPKNDEIQPTLLYCNDNSTSIFMFMTDCIEVECAAWQNGHCVRVS